MDQADALADLLGQRPVAGTAAEGAPMGAKRGAHRLRSWCLIVAGLVAGAIWVFIAARTIAWAIRNGWFFPSSGGAVVDFFANLVLFGGLALIPLIFTRLAPLARPRIVTTHRGLFFLLGLALGLAGLLSCALQAAAGDHLRAADQAGAVSLAALGAGTLITFVEAGVEELFFRAWLQRRAAELIRPAGAVAFAAFCFSLLHVFGGARTPLSLANIFIAGLFFGLLALRTGSVLAATGAHFAWNWSETILTGLSPNPGAPPYGSLFDYELVGSALWGGSDEGLNASIAVTFAIVALILPLLAYRPKPQPA